MNNNTDKTTIDISKRTGGEWKVCGANQDQIFSVDSLGKMRICETDGASEEQRANAAFIVTACNNYDKLVEVLNDILYSFGRHGRPSDKSIYTANQLLQSIEENI